MTVTSSPFTLLKRVATFLFGLSLLFAAMETLLRADPDGNCYAAKMQALNKVRDQVEILFLGSSHAEHAVDPSVAPFTGFNLAHPSETVPYSYAVAHYWVPRLPRLKAVVLSISYFSLQMTTDVPEQWRSRFYSYYYPNDDRPATLDEWLSRRSLTYVYGFGHLRVPLQDAIRAGIGLPAPAYYSSSGADMQAMPRPQREELTRSADAHARIQKAYMRQQNEADTLDLLKQFANELRARHISLVLMTTPVTPEYAAFMDGRSWHRQLNALQQLCRETGTIYVDYSRDSRFAYDDFVDGDHLCRSGAIKFTRLLASTLLARGVVECNYNCAGFALVKTAAELPPRQSTSDHSLHQ